MRYIPIPYRSNTFGILRWISKRLEIKNLFGNELINLSVDSTITYNIAAPIGYVNDSYNWWASNNEEKEHFYIVDFKTFRTSVKGISLSMSPEHFHKVFYIAGCNDGVTWNSIKEARFPSQPGSSLQYIPFDSQTNYRYYKISVNGQRYNDGYALSISTLDFNGNILWDVDNTCKQRTKRPTNVFYLMICLLP